MTLVSSTAHTFHYRWFVQWVRTPSSPRLASRPATGLLLTHLLKEQLRVSVLLIHLLTATIVALKLQTSCNPEDLQGLSRVSFGGLFFYEEKCISVVYTLYILCVYVVCMLCVCCREISLDFSQKMDYNK